MNEVASQGTVISVLRQSLQSDNVNVHIHDFSLHLSFHLYSCLIYYFMVLPVQVKLQQSWLWRVNFLVRTYTVPVYSN